jgi:hypothetical protein
MAIGTAWHCAKILVIVIKELSQFESAITPLKFITFYFAVRHCGLH